MAVFCAKSCMVTNHAYGKAFELLGTAAYQALHEFGGIVGIDNPGQYIIRLSDPRSANDLIEVGLIHKKGYTFKRYDGSAPIRENRIRFLEGDGLGARRWIELKSWRYNSSGPNKYLSMDGKTLDKSLFPLWDGKSNGDSIKKYTTKAHKQAFLDYAFSRSALKAEFCDHQDYSGEKPSKTTTWIQVWELGERSWCELIKDDGKYTLGK